jgi:hypothetical protein
LPPDITTFIGISAALRQKSNQKRTPKKDYTPFFGWFPD